MTKHRRRTGSTAPSSPEISPSDLKKLRDARAARGEAAILFFAKSLKSAWASAAGDKSARIEAAKTSEVKAAMKKEWAKLLWHRAAAHLIVSADAERIPTEDLLYAYELSRYDKRLERTLFKGLVYAVTFTVGFGFGRGWELRLLSILPGIRSIIRTEWVATLFSLFAGLLVIAAGWMLYWKIIRGVVMPWTEHEHIREPLKYLCIGEVKLAEPDFDIIPKP